MPQTNPVVLIVCSVFYFGHLGFEFVSDFDIRTSDFAQSCFNLNHTIYCDDTLERLQRHLDLPYKSLY